jgi:hypothetical protein
MAVLRRLASNARNSSGFSRIHLISSITETHSPFFTAYVPMHTGWFFVSISFGPTFSFSKEKVG